MLVLTRKTDQSITLGNPLSPEPVIEITVIEVRGDQVRLGITAPQSVPVHRKEIYLQVQQENEAASQTPASTPASTIGKTLDQIRRRKK